jgi:hypothetical protein
LEKAGFFPIPLYAWRRIVNRARIEGVCMKNFVKFLAIGLMAFSAAVVVGVAQASRGGSSSSVNSLSAQGVVPTLLVVTPTSQVIDVISADKAGQLAIQAAGFGETVTNTPFLVNFEGKIAYEVVMIGGYTAYIDAVTGAMLYNPFTGDTSATVNSDLAIQAASQYAKSNSVYGWGVVLYQQVPVYAVGFNNGDLILVNAHGKVVFEQQADASSEREHASNGP